MKRCWLGFFVPVVLLAQAPAVSRQQSSGPCSPNIVKSGAGNLTIQYTNSCNSADRRLLQDISRKLETFVEQFPATIQHLNELLALKDTELADKVAELQRFQSEIAKGALVKQGWIVSERQGVLRVEGVMAIPPESIPVLNSLPSPVAVAVGGPAITDLMPLCGLRNLTRLEIASPIFGITPVTDISCLGKITGLTELYLGPIDATDFTPLGVLRDLTSLTLSGVKISDISMLQSIPHLTKLDLEFDDNIRDLSVLRGLKLTDLSLSMLKVSTSELAVISALTDLQSLTLIFFKDLTDVTILAGLSNLTYLDLTEDMNLVDISPLKELHQLRSLIIRATSITHLSPLEHITSLRSLNISGLRVTDLSALSGLTELKITQ